MLPSVAADARSPYQRFVGRKQSGRCRLHSSMYWPEIGVSTADRLHLLHFGIDAEFWHSDGDAEPDLVSGPAATGTGITSCWSRR